MKNIAVFALLAVTIFFTHQTVKIQKKIDLGSLLNIALADDLEGVTIICSGGDYGRCFRAAGGFCHSYPSTDIWGECQFTGMQVDNCDSAYIFDDCGGSGDGHY